MIIWLEWGICSGKTTIWKLLAKKLGWYFIEEHTPRIKNKEAFNLEFKTAQDFLKTFKYFLDVEIERNTSLDENKIYIFDRTIYSLLWFAYSKWKLDNIDYISHIKMKEFSKKLKNIDYLFIINIDNNLRIERLKKDKLREKNTPSLFYKEDFNFHNNYYLNNIKIKNKFIINWENNLDNILKYIISKIWKNI